MRAAEAITLRDYATGLLDGQGQQRAVIGLGDLKDEPLAATTQMLLGPPGSEMDAAGLDARMPARQRLWNLAPSIQPEDRRFRRVFNGRPEFIDHILGAARRGSGGGTAEDVRQRLARFARRPVRRGTGAAPPCRRMIWITHRAMRRRSGLVE